MLVVSSIKMILSVVEYILSCFLETGLFAKYQDEMMVTAFTACTQYTPTMFWSILVCKD